MVDEQQEPVIRVEGLTHGFGPVDVLDDLSFTIPRGAICGLLGPNGSGKTTLIQLLLGVLLPRGGGKMEVLGLDPRSEAVEIRRRVGYVPQVTDLDLGLTVGGTCDFLRPFFGARWKEEVFEGQLRRFGLDTMRDVLFDSLSVGLKQRVALVAALATGWPTLRWSAPWAAWPKPVTHPEDLMVSVTLWTAVGTVIVLGIWLFPIENRWERRKAVLNRLPVKRSWRRRQWMIESRRPLIVVPLVWLGVWLLSRWFIYEVLAR